MANPFGASPAASPFGASGQGANPFATPATPGSAFGAPSTPGSAFGAAASPFGQTTTPLFGGAGFGAATSQPAFGAAASSSSVFGAASTPAFGSTASPFGGGTSLFGQQQQQQQQKPAFGTFGATQPGANPFGASAFGQQPAQPAFGASGSAFGSSAFGASAPAFGGTPGFGASTPGFGAAASAPVFGGSTSPAFGTGGGLFGSSAPAPAFGALGSTPSAFGAASGSAFGSSPFGATQFGAGAGATGSRVAPYAPTPDTESGGAVGTPVGNFVAITAMPGYRGKSVEELRWEDYQKGDKGGPAPAGANPFGQQAGAAANPFGGSAFGAAASSSPFGASATAPSLFGAATPAFGAASTPAFGAASTPAFGATGSSLFGASAPAFGATPAPAFGATPAPAFGMGATASTPAFGAAQSSSNLFGGSTFGATSPFGAASTPFGSTPRLPATGFTGFGAASASAPAFGAAGTSLFGTPGAPTGGGLFGSSQAASGSAFGGGGFSFGSASAPGFGASSGAGLFGASTGAATGGLFGASGAGSGFGFGALQTKPAGLTSSTGSFAFGGGFGAGTGAQSGSAFGIGLGGASQPGTGLFGQSAPGSLFGGPSPSTGSALGTPGLFSFPQTSQAAGTQPQLLQQQQQQQQQLQQQQLLLQQQMMLQQLGMAGIPLQSPFGVLPPLPPVFKQGATAGTPQAGLGSGSPATGIASLPRSLERTRPARTPIAAQRLLTTPSRVARQRATAASSRARSAMLARSWLFAPPMSEPTPKVPFFQEPGNAAGVPLADTLVVPRENPRALFIRGPVREVPSPFEHPTPAPPKSPATQGPSPSAPPLPPNGALDGTAANGTPPGSQAPKQTGDAAEAELRRKGKMPEGTSTASGVETGAGKGDGAVGAGAPPGGPREEEVQRVLPKLRSSDWYTEPSRAELAARERAAPGFCARVRDFVVGRRGFGSVKFLGDTDVRHLDLESLIQFPRLELVVYPDEDLKPPEGTELNKPAIVTIQGVFCINKATNERVIAGEALERFVQRLKSKTTEQGAEFLAYDASNGEWSFKVDHFSRYGLADLDNDDMDSEAPDPSVGDVGAPTSVPAGGPTVGPVGGGAMAGKHRGGEKGSERGSGSERESEEGMGVPDPDFAVGGASGYAAGAPGNGLAGAGPFDAVPPFGGPPSMDSARLQQLRAAFFGAGEEEEGPEDGNFSAEAWGSGVPRAYGAPQGTAWGRMDAATGLPWGPAAGAQGRFARGVPQAHQPAATPSKSPSLQVRDRGSPLIVRTRTTPSLAPAGTPPLAPAGATPLSASRDQQQGTPGPALKSPQPRASPIQPGFVLSGQVDGGCTFPELSSSHIPGLSALPPPRTGLLWAPKGGSSSASLALQGKPFGAPGLEGPEGYEEPSGGQPLVYRETSLGASVAVEASHFLGRSFRVGWGPGGVLVHTGYTAGSGYAPGSNKGALPLSSVVRVQRVAYHRVISDAQGGVPEVLAQRRLVGPLLVHLSLSRMGPASEEGPMGAPGEGQSGGWVGRGVVCRRAAELGKVCEGYASLAEASRALREEQELAGALGGNSNNDDSHSSNSISRVGGVVGVSEALEAERVQGWDDSLRTEAMAWRLLHSLFGEDAGGAPGSGAPASGGALEGVGKEGPGSEAGEGMEGEDDAVGMDVMDVSQREAEEEEEGEEEEGGARGGGGSRGGGAGAGGGGGGGLTLFGTCYDAETQAMFRRVSVSDWLQDQVEESVEDDLQALEDAQAQPQGLEAIFIHLTGMQVEEAVERAVERGEPRLATLLALSGALLPQGRKDIAAQLTLWDSLETKTRGITGTGAGAAIEETRKQLLQLLAGDVGGAVGHRDLDWKRMLGLVMWFSSAPEDPLQTSVRAFQELLASGVAPPPLPLYLEFGPPGAPVDDQDAGGVSCEDVLYGLLKLYCSTSPGMPADSKRLTGGPPVDGSGVSSASLAQLLTCQAWTPDALDCQFGWHLQSLLQALGVVHRDAALPALTMDYVAELLAAGQCHWALYVLQHSLAPTSPLGRAGTAGAPQVQRLAQEVLALYCPVWSTSEEQRAFIETDLGMPLAWMDQAQAVYHRYARETQKELQALMGSEQWDAAHQLLMNDLAPDWLLAGKFAEVKRAAQALVGHKDRIRFWTEGAGLLLDLDFLLSALEEQEEAEEAGEEGRMLEAEEAAARSKAAFDDAAKRTALSLERFPGGADKLRAMYGDMLGLLSQKLIAGMERRSLPPLTLLDAYKSTVPSNASHAVRWRQMHGATSTFADWICTTSKC